MASDWFPDRPKRGQVHAIEYNPGALSPKAKKIMTEIAEYMLRYVNNHPRWPGALTTKSSPSRGMYVAMDESANDREVAYWENQVRVYKEAVTA